LDAVILERRGHAWPISWSFLVEEDGARFAVRQTVHDDEVVAFRHLVFLKGESMKWGIAAILALSSVVPIFAALMLHTETTIPKPLSEETTILRGLVYKARFEAKVTSLRLAVKSETGADQVAADWVFTGSNSDGQIHSLAMEVRLLDEKGSQIGVFTARHSLSAGARDEPFAVPMKVKSAVWEATRRIRIWANWMSYSG
jgi:hypothetical protein